MHNVITPQPELEICMHAIGCWTVAINTDHYAATLVFNFKSSYIYSFTDFLQGVVSVGGLGLEDF